MFILAPILPNRVLSGLGLSFPTREQMDMLMRTLDCFEINTQSYEAQTS